MRKGTKNVQDLLFKAFDQANTNKEGRKEFNETIQILDEDEFIKWDKLVVQELTKRNGTKFVIDPSEKFSKTVYHEYFADI